MPVRQPRCPDVAATVAVEVDRVGVVGGGNELGLAHGAGPGAAHPLGADVAALEDLQGGEQLGASELRPPAFVSEGGQRANDRLVAHDLAKAAFQTPHGDKRLAIHTVAVFDAGQRVGMFGQ